MFLGSMIAAGGVIAAATLLKQEQQTAEAGDGGKLVEIKFAEKLSEGHMKSLQVGEEKD